VIGREIKDFHMTTTKSKTGASVAPFRRLAGVSLTSLALLAAPMSDVWAAGRGGGDRP